MGNIITYVQTEMSRMTEKPFNVADSLVLAEFAYVGFNEAVPGLRFLSKAVGLNELYKAELWDSMFHVLLNPENIRTLLFAAAASPRFRDIRLRFFVDDFNAGQEQQFSAVTFLLPDDTAFIAFRGTDNSLVGWKEDFNMAFQSPVPSQRAATEYLNATAKRLPGRMKLHLGGHSKGGNLAVYAAMNCNPSAQRRIIDVYNHDGPGFKDSALDTPEYKAIEARVHKIMPQSSVVGMLLSDRQEYKVVESRRFGLMQHDAFSWEMDGDDFVYVEKLTVGALYMHKTLNQWLETLPDDQRHLLVESLFRLIDATDAESVADLTDTWGKSALSMLGTYRSLDVETRRILSQVIRALLKLSVRNLRSKDSPDKQKKSRPAPLLTE